MIPALLMNNILGLLRVFQNCRRWPGGVCPTSAGIYNLIGLKQGHYSPIYIISVSEGER
jgi:hypothetical protein